MRHRSVSNASLSFSSMTGRPVRGGTLCYRLVQRAVAVESMALRRRISMPEAENRKATRYRVYWRQWGIQMAERQMARTRRAAPSGGCAMTSEVSGESPHSRLRIMRTGRSANRTTCSTTEPRSRCFIPE